MQCGGVADANGFLAVVAGPVFENALFKILGSIHPVKRREVEPARASGDIEEILQKLFAFLKLAQQSKSIQNVVGVSKPAVPVIPRPSASRRFGYRRRHCGNDGAGVFKAMKLERKRGTNHLLLVERRNVAVFYPALPVSDGLAPVALAQWSQSFLNR